MRFLQPPVPDKPVSRMTPEEKREFKARRREYQKTKALIQLGALVCVVLLIAVIVVVVTGNVKGRFGNAGERRQKADVSGQADELGDGDADVDDGSNEDDGDAGDENSASEGEKDKKSLRIGKSSRSFVYELVHDDGSTTVVKGALGANLKTKAEREAEAAEKAAALAKRMDHSATRARAREIYATMDPVQANANSTAIIEEINRVVYSAVANANTVDMPAEVESPNAILINMDMDFVVAQKAATDRIYPASMTKVLTVLVAAEAIEKEASPEMIVLEGKSPAFYEKLKEKVEISSEATSYAFKNDCSTAGFSENETVTVEDLFYGTILPSGGDAAYQLAVRVAGSHEEFVNMMNKKLEDLKLSDSTHFVNAVGLYDDNHYSTCYDIAMIMEAALANEFCSRVLTAHVFTTSSTSEHADGLELSNWFLRRIEDKEFGGIIEGAKTGYVNESGNCAVSTEKSNSGTRYLCVTAGADSGWKCIYDHVDAYAALGK